MADQARLIEHAFPLKQASLTSVHEKNVRHGHISTLHIWPARRPLAACRAALIATLLPDPGTPEKRKELCERIGGKVVETTERKKMPNGKVVEVVKEEVQGGILNWIGTEPKSGSKKKKEEHRAVVAHREKELQWFRDEIRKAYGGRVPRVLDPFAGGGAIPLEAMRLGCEATAADINPVAWFILKCTLEYPQKLAGKTHPLPEFILDDEAFMADFYKAHPHLVGRTKKTRQQAEEDKSMLPGFVKPDSGRAPKADLAWHVRAWGRWVLNQARKELAPFYPTYADFLPASRLGRSAQTGSLRNLPITTGSEMYYVYVLECSDDSFYVGQTEHLDRRFRQHEGGEVPWTAPRLPVKLVHWEELRSRQDAVNREAELKTGFGRKWIQREFKAKRLRAQLYEMRLVPLSEDGKPDIDRLNEASVDPYFGEHEWGRPTSASLPSGPVCAERREAGRWVAKLTVAYLWARTVTCKNCRATVPLLKTRWLCKKTNKRVLLTMEPKADGTGVTFGIDANVPVQGGNPAQRREHDKRIGPGTMSRAGAQCPCCGTIMTSEDLRTEGKAGRMGAMPTAVVTESQTSKAYRLPIQHEIECAAHAEAELERVFAEIPFGLPVEPIAAGGSRAGGGSPFTVHLYGLDEWQKLFTPRQAHCLGVFLRQSRRFRTTMRDRYADAEWGDGINAGLTIGMDRIADRQSTVCRWDNTRDNLQGTFTRFALPITWDFCEGNPISGATGNYLSNLSWVCEAWEHIMDAVRTSPPATVLQQSAAALRDDGLDCIVTDPPYYDAIPYSDLMDFFYVWLRRTLAGCGPETAAAFGAPLSPKWDHDASDGELIDDASRHGGDAAESKVVYEAGMAQVFLACHGALRPQGRLVVVFAHKHPNAWETLVSAIIRAGFTVDGSWPIQTEMANRTRGLSSAALASSLWIVCRKRPATAKLGWDNRVLEEMRANITDRLRDYWDAGIRGPDFVWAATGPALEAYSKHPAVKKANDPGQVMAVGEFLIHVRRMVVDFVVGQVMSGEQDGEMGAADRMDSPTAYYLLHRHDFGLDDAPAGACILYATACGISDRDLGSTWDLISSKGGASVPLADDPSDESDPSDDEDSDADSGGTSSGGQMKLKPWLQRKGRNMGYDAPSGLSACGHAQAGRPVPLIDRIHRLMHLWRAGDVHKVDDYLDDNGLRRHELFKRLVQSLIELSDRSSEERTLLESLSNHIGARGAVRDDRQGRLAFGEGE